MSMNPGEPDRARADVAGPPGKPVVGRRDVWRQMLAHDRLIAPNLLKRSWAE